MAILSFPPIRQPSNASFVLAGNTQSHSSPFTQSTQTIGMPGDRWQGVFSWDRLQIEEWRAVSVFQASLRGRAGRFYLRPMHAWRRGTCPGTPVVLGGGQTGSQLITQGWIPDGSSAFLAGDFLSLPDANGRPSLHMVTEPAGPDGDGICGMWITPPLRSSPPDGAPVEATNPVGVFMITADDGGETRVSPPYTGAFTLEFVQALFG